MLCMHTNEKVRNMLGRLRCNFDLLL